jgi:LCP family protein required for cell wall assembly
MNILLIGSNTRTGLDPSEAAAFGSAQDVPGARSDVTMILHLDPATGSASLLSIPRDLFVDLPPHSVAGSVGKIDGALNDGPDNLIAAITSSLGIPINHYVEINFDGFRRSIDAIGGIRMNFPTPLRDTLSGLRINQVGCQSLNGTTALAVVRARHLQYLSNGRWLDDPLSDLARIRRDHTFLRVFVTASKAQATNPFKLNSLIGALLNQVTVDSGMNLNTFINLFRRYRHLNPDMVPETTLPITVVRNYHYGNGAYGDIDMPVEPLDHQAINAWLGQPAAPGTPSSTSVEVVNVSGFRGKAATFGSELSGLGYHVTSTTTGLNRAYTTETVIRYAPGDSSAALGLLGHLSGAVLLHSDTTLAPSTLRVDVGSLVTVSATVGTTPPAGAPAASPASTPSTSSAAAAPTTTTSSIPTPQHQPPSSSQDQPAPFDPTACA